MFVTLLKLPVEVPPVLEMATRTPEEIALPFASFNVAVTVTVEPEATVPDDTEIVDVVALAGPGVTSTDTVGPKLRR